MRVAELGMPVEVRVGDVDQREIVNLAVTQDSTEDAGSVADERLRPHHARIDGVQARRVDDGEALGARDLEEHRVLPVEVQHRRLGRSGHPEIARLRGR